MLQLPMASSRTLVVVHRLPSRHPGSTSCSGRLQPYISPHVRPFTQKPSLLLLARPFPRPQLPFLHPGHSLPVSLSQTSILTSSVTRYISTERKNRWKQQFWAQVRFHSYFWPILTLILVMYAGVRHVKLERRFPTPRDWGFSSRWAFRMAKYVENGEDDHTIAGVKRGVTDWGRVGRYWEEVLRNTEQSLDPLQSGNGNGRDVSAKSDQWKRGYVEALMGAATAAEHLDGYYRRKGNTRGWLNFGGGAVRLYPKDTILSPDNPRPKPLPWDRKYGREVAPNWNDVEPAYDSPDVFYTRILESEGLDNRQKMDAALAFADWLDFADGAAQSESSLFSTQALEQHRLALDLACQGLPETVRDKVVDANTGIINKTYDDLVTENVLKATTSLGVHYAKHGQVKDALPVFLSVLRARKTLPPSPYGATGQQKKPAYEADGGIEEYLSIVKDLVVEGPYPPPPPSGNERPFHTLKEACEEVGLMTYIGEILFATSASEREKGLSWTRDSVEAAEAVMWAMDEEKVDDGRDKCRQCLQTGLQNWRQMAQQMSRLAAQKEHDIENKSGPLGLGWPKSSRLAKAHEEVMRWEGEKEAIELRRQKTLPLTQPLRSVRGGWEARR